MSKVNLETAFDMFKAISIIEGFAGYEQATPTQTVQAWSYLIKTGKVWELQGCYGRAAARMITEGYIDKQGNILIDLQDE